MYMELQEYCVRTLPKTTLLDQRIKPLLTTVRQKYINSVHQLQQQLYSTKSEQLAGGKDKQSKKLIFSSREASSRIKGDLQQRKRSPNNKQKIYWTIETKRQSKTVQLLRKNQQQYGSIINPLSKVKRHLVDRIDFQQLQNAMFRKTSTINRFQNFCKNLQEKATSPSKPYRHNKTMQTLRVRGDKSKEQSPESMFTTIYEPEENCFRISRKKRFWQGNSESGRRLRVYGQRMQVRGSSAV